MKKLGTDARLKKKLQEVLDLNVAENAAMDNANNPSASNPFATMADITDLGLSSDELAAVDGASTPSGSNPFATLDDLPEKVIDVTYDELVALMDSSGDGLVPGQFYRITDYRTVHWVVSDTDGATYILDSNNDKEVITGDLEPLIVLATSENTIDIHAYSEIHPEDIIEYQIELGEGYEEIPGLYFGSPVDGFKGLITYRTDTVNKLAAPFDWRVLTYEDGKKTFGDDCYHITILYSVIYSAIFPIIKIGDNCSFIHIESSCLAVTIGDFNTNIEIDVWNMLLTIGNTNSNITIGSYCSGVDSQTIIGNSNNDIILEDYADTNIIGNGCNEIRLEMMSANNIIGDACYNIKIEAGSYFNVIADDSYNVKIGQGSSHIELGDSSGGVSNIDIGQGCGGDGKDIVIGGLCKDISLGNSCKSITIVTEAETLSFGNNCGVNGSINIDYLCWGISFENGCSNINIGQESSNISFENGCGDIIIGKWSGNLVFESGCMYITLPEISWYNTFLTGCDCDVLKDFTDSSVVQLNNIHVTHRRSGTKLVGTYLEEQSDGSFVEVHAEDIIGVAVY